MPKEVEIRLSSHDGDVMHLVDAAFERFVAEPSETAELVTVYYDTADLAISKAGLSLRVRQRPDASYVQAVKTSDTGALASERGEWESPVTTPVPDFARIPDLSLREHLHALTGNAPLEPKVETRIARTTRLLRTISGDEIELAIDRGHIRALSNGHETIGVHEIELELKQGSPAALYEVAQALTRAGGFSVVTESKVQRGLRAMQGLPPAAHKAGTVHVNPKATAEDAFRTILLHCLRHIAENLPAIDARLPDGLHQARVGLRRLRVALTGFDPAFRTARLDAVQERAKVLAKALGATRELDVFAEELLPSYEQAADSAAAGALRNGLKDLRNAAWNEVLALVHSRDFADFLLDGAACAETRAWREAPDEDRKAFARPAPDAARDALVKRLRDVRKRAKHLSALDKEERHELRIALKKLRYAVEFFSSLFPREPVARFLKQLEKTQDAFGDLNDAATAKQVLARVVEHAGNGADDMRTSADEVGAWHRERAKRIWKKARKRFKRLQDTEPFWAAGTAQA